MAFTKLKSYSEHLSSRIATSCRLVMHRLAESIFLKKMLKKFRNPFQTVTHSQNCSSVVCKPVFSQGERLGWPAFSFPGLTPQWVNLTHRLRFSLFTKLKTTNLDCQPTRRTFLLHPLHTALTKWEEFQFFLTWLALKRKSYFFTA